MGVPCVEKPITTMLLLRLLFVEDFTKSGLQWWCTVVRSRSICRRQHPTSKRTPLHGIWGGGYFSAVSDAVTCAPICNAILLLWPERAPADLCLGTDDRDMAHQRRVASAMIKPWYGNRIKYTSSQAWCAESSLCQDKGCCALPLGKYLALLQSCEPQLIWYDRSEQR